MEMTVSIGRSSSGEIRIEVMDQSSRIRFLELEMTPHDFAEALTGLGHVPAIGTVRGLANVGKIKVRESRRTFCPLQSYNKDELVAWLKENAQEEGWTLDYYLGAQSSVMRADNGMYLNYRVYKFVDSK